MIDYIGGSSSLRIVIINKNKHEMIIYTTPAMPARKWQTTSEALFEVGFSKSDEESMSITVEKGDDGKFEDICRLVEEFAKGGKKEIVKIQGVCSDRQGSEEIKRMSEGSDPERRVKA
jgi:hypothetical protein